MELFGYIGRSSVIRDIGLINVDVTGTYATGGLAAGNLGTISGSYATGNVEAFHDAGGLVGYNSGTISASYAKGSVSGREVTAGGLVGANPGTIIAGYASGRVGSGENEYVGGLVGSNSGRTTSNFWDTQTSGYETGVGNGDSTSAECKTPAELRSPTGYDGIYSAWAGTDDFWDFGTSCQYPALKVDFDGDGNESWQEFGKQVR